MCNCTDDFTIYGNEFTTPNTYVNKFLNGRYRLILNGTKKLVFNTDWECAIGGGFNILIPGFEVTPDTIICGEFY